MHLKLNKTQFFQKLHQKLHNIFVTTLLLILLSSCKDYGCIDANDYGQYESEVLYVSANGDANRCEYDPYSPISDNNIDMASEFGKCISENTTDFDYISYDEDGGPIEGSLTGPCTKYSDPENEQQNDDNQDKLNQCIAQCQDKCRQSTEKNSANSVPGWQSTSYRRSDVNRGITIEPGVEITIKATGEINLADTQSYYDALVDASKSSMHTSNPNLYYIDEPRTINIGFGGEWSNGNDFTSGTVNSNIGEDSYNFGRRLLFRYTKASQGYKINSSGADEFSALQAGVPLKINGDKWHCSGSENDGVIDITNCSADYSTQYNKINDAAIAAGSDDQQVRDDFNQLVNSAYPIFNNELAYDPGIYGGLIRATTEDGLFPQDNDPIDDKTCSVNGDCTNQSISNAVDSGIIEQLGDLSSGEIIKQNTRGYPVKISIRSLALDDNHCGKSENNDPFSLEFKILDEDNNQIFPSSGYHTFSPLISSWDSTIVEPSNSNDATYNIYQDISLEPGHQIVFKNNPQSNDNDPVINCGSFTFLKFDKYLDIEVKNSGFVSFADTLPDLPSNQNCKIYGRIINPNGNHTAQNISVDIDNTTYQVTLQPDFYEYRHGNDPLQNQGIDVNDRNPAGDNSWSDKILVRKGQIIRFDPKSWDNQCGVGYAMQIEKRPAILCSGTGSEYIRTPDCAYDIDDSGNLLGCQAQYPECFDPDSNQYCQNTECYAEITCDTDGSAPFYQKTNCRKNAISNTNSNIQCSGTTLTDGSNNPNRYCNACNNGRLTSAKKAARTQLEVDACYDFENYEGSIKNILNPASTPAIDSYTLINYQDFARNARKAGEFNGEYGVFTDIRADEETVTIGSQDYLKLHSNRPITLTNKGLIEFLIIDDNDPLSFKDILPQNRQSSGSAIISFSGKKVARNGKFLQVALCKEAQREGKDLCHTLTATSDDYPNLSGKESDVVSFNFSNDNPSGRYNFDSDGYIYRDGNIIAIDGSDCSQSNNDAAITTSNNSRFFCHTEDLNAEGVDLDDEYAKYRLSFRIYDPEDYNCVLDAVTGNMGVKINNANYIADDAAGGSASNDGAICDEDDPIECKKEYRCVNKYYNNSGEYRVEIKAKVSNKKISEFVASVINPIIKLIDGDPNAASEEARVGQVEKFYRALISDPIYKSIVTISMVLMITFYGFSYLMGVSEFSNSEIVGRVFKIGLIYFFIGENGWEYFDRFIVTLFKDSADQLAFLMASGFDDSPAIKTALDSGDFYNKAALFSSVDKVFDLVFADAVQNKIKALLFANIFGWAYCLLVYYGLFVYVIAVANAVLIYLTAQVFISILFTLGPIFFVFILFEQTKDMFDNWLKALIGFALQQIFLLTTLAFFNMLIYEIIKMVLNYRICYLPVWVIDLYFLKITILEYWTVASMPPALSSHVETGSIGKIEGFPSIFKVLFIWVVASLMGQFVKFMTDLATSIGGGISATSLASSLMLTSQGVRGAVSKAAQALDNQAQRLTGQSVGRSLALADKALFDSGNIAKKERREKRAQNAKDQSNKSYMAKSGADAVSQYKRNNAQELLEIKSKGGEEAVLEKLQSIKNDAMNKAGEKRGLKQEEIDNLKKDKGLKYEGNNAFGAAAKAAYQGVTTGGSLKNSINEKTTKTSFSESEVKESMKNMEVKKSDLDKKGNEKFKKEFEEAIEKVGDNPKEIAKVERAMLDKFTKERTEEFKNNIDAGNINIQRTAGENAKKNFKSGAGKVLNTLVVAPAEIAGAIVVGAPGVAIGVPLAPKKYRDAITSIAYDGIKRLTGLKTLSGKEDESPKSIAKNVIGLGSLYGAIQATAGSAASAMGGKKSAEKAKEKMKDVRKRVAKQGEGVAKDIKKTYSAISKTYNNSNGIKKVAARISLPLAGAAVITAGLGSLATRTAAAIAGGVSDGLGITQNMNSSMERQEVRKDLMDKGEIDRMPKGAEWARSKEDHAKIDAAMAQNKQKARLESETGGAEYDKSIKRDLQSRVDLTKKLADLSDTDSEKNQNRGQYHMLARRLAARSISTLGFGVNKSENTDKDE